MTASPYAYPLLIKHLLHAPLACAPGQQIVYRDLSRYTYRTLHERIGRLAGALTRAGVRPGDVVAVMDWDSHRYLECFFAIPMLGAVLQTVNVRLSPEQIAYTLNHAGPCVILVHADFLPVLEAIRARLETVRTLVLIADGAAPPGSALEFAGEYEELLESAPVVEEFPELDENTRATTFYTTGTTGLPKGVYFSHRQLVLHTLAVLVNLGLATRQGRLHGDDVYMPITPMFHVHAWGFPYAATLVGLKQVYPGRYSPDLLLRLRATEGVTFSHCVPTILSMLLSCPEARAADLRGWKFVVGGSALPKQLARLALERGIDIFGGYGMSETGPVLTIAHLDAAVLDADPETEVALRTKAGRPLPLVDLRVVDEAMRDRPHDGSSVGEVVARAPWLTQGYLKDAAASERLWSGGYLHTGDIGHIDAAGYLQITDRIKDVIKTGGEWISSLVLEDIIASHPAVREVAVIGVPDEKWGERPMALIVPARKGDADNAADIRAHVMRSVEAGLLSKYGVPERILFVDTLEKTSVGKLDKKALRARYAAG